MFQTKDLERRNYIQIKWLADYVETVKMKAEWEWNIKSAHNFYKSKQKKKAETMKK